MVIKRILIIFLLLPFIGLGQNQESLLSSNIKHLERAKKEIISIKSKHDLFGSCVADSCKEALMNADYSLVMLIENELDGKKTYSTIITRDFHLNGIVRQVYIPESWHPAGTTTYSHKHPDIEEKHLSRWEFVGKPAIEKEHLEYMYKDVSWFYKKGEQTSTRYTFQ